VVMNNGRVTRFVQQLSTARCMVVTEWPATAISWLNFASQVVCHWIIVQPNKPLARTNIFLSFPWNLLFESSQFERDNQGFFCFLLQSYKPKRKNNGFRVFVTKSPPPFSPKAIKILNKY
jgi:hypothetical protein